MYSYLLRDFRHLDLKNGPYSSNIVFLILKIRFSFQRESSHYTYLGAELLSDKGSLAQSAENNPEPQSAELVIAHKMHAIQD